MTRISRVGLIGFMCTLGFWSATSAYEIVEVNDPGKLTGTVSFSGHVPAPRTFEVQKNPEICGSQRSLTKVSVHNGRLQGVVLALQHVTGGKAFEEKTLHANRPGKGEFHYQAGKQLALNVRTENCNFGPFTGVVARDQPVRFSNRDSIKHTLHTYVKRGTKATILKTVHNRGIQPSSTIEETFTAQKLPDPGVVALTCDRHDFMENWLYVVDNPYFAVSDENGQFHIDGIPPGDYHLVAWHPILGTQEHTVTIAPQRDTALHFSFKKP